MSRHHHADLVESREKPLVPRRLSHHGSLNYKATSVIGHLKTKVIRKRSSKQDSLESTDSLRQGQPFTADAESHPEPNVFDADDENEITSQSRTGDRDQQVPQSKPSALKATKSLPESNTKKRRQTLRRTGLQVRDEDFNHIFSDLPSDEQLMIAYPCAWRKDVFMHGRLFLTMNYLCFYTCFFKWEESLCIAYKDIVSVTREKSVKVVPNAIKLRTKTNERYLFASFVPRERIIVAIFRLWQNALLEQPMDYQQIRTILYADQQTPEGSTGDSEESLNLENSQEPAVHSQSLPTMSTHSKAVPMRATLPSVPSRRVVSLTGSADHKSVPFQTTCPCETHLAKTHVDRLFTFDVDTLYELIFGDNSFTRAFHASQKLTDYQMGPWEVNTETNKRERLVTYRTVTHSILGTNSLFCQEKQVFETDKAHSVYVVSCEVRNEGMKYTDAFFVATRFCMTQRDAEHSSLRVSAEIKYVKSVNGFIKSFIEKNANSSIENGINDQVRRLENQQITHVSRSADEQLPPKSKKSSRQHPEEVSVALPEVQLSPKHQTITGRGVLVDLGLFIGLFFAVVHVYLCYKLYSIDQTLFTPYGRCLDQCKKTCLENHTSR